MIKAKQLVHEYRLQIGRFSYAQLDCIGSIAGIIRRHGGTYDLMGSNWWARHEIKNLRPLTHKSQLFDGCAVLKTLHPGEAGYNLPDRYLGDAVQIDYNHIGLGTSNGEILDSTTQMIGGTYVRNGPGVSTAPINERSWDVIGEFEDVDYSDEDSVSDIPISQEDVMKRALVVASVGSTVNLRAKPSLGSVVLEYVKVGSLVDVFEKSGEWQSVCTASGKNGWMKSEFLSMDEPQPEDPDRDTSLPAIAGLTAQQEQKLLQAIGLIEEVLGHG